MDTVVIPRKFEMEKYFPLVKVDKTKHTAYGLATCEKEDKDGEICDYEGAKEQYQIWSREAVESTTAAGQDISLGNIRYMHRLILAGKATMLKFDDSRKQIWLESTPSPPLSKEDPDVWPLLEGGFLRGYSQGGKYISRTCNDCRKDIQGNFCVHCNKRVLVRYVPSISEVSYVDNPCLKEAAFTLVKSDGSVELKKFVPPELLQKDGVIPTSPTPVPNAEMPTTCQCDCGPCKANNCSGCTMPGCQCSDGVPAQGKAAKNMNVKYLIKSKDGKEYLPYTDEAGKTNIPLMAKAWYSLHDNFPGQKYDGPEKPKAIKLLRQMFAKEGRDTPSERASEVEKFVKDSLENVIQSRAYGQLGKGMYEVSRFAQLTEDLKYLWLTLEWEREVEQDESPVTDDIKEIYMSLLDHLVAYVEEEVSEAKEHEFA